MDWKKLIAGVAPTIAGLVTGPFAPLAMGATAALSNLLLGKSDGTDDELAAAVQNMTPEQQIAVKQLDMQWEKQRQDFLLAQGQQQLDSDRLDTQNTADARARDIALSAHGENWRADAAVVFVCLGLISCLLSLAFFRDRLPGEAVGIISTIAGIFGGCLKDYFNFEFGSSRESRQKDAVIANVATTPVTVDFKR
jgi:hypothetical protein